MDWRADIENQMRIECGAIKWRDFSWELMFLILFVTWSRLAVENSTYTDEKRLKLRSDHKPKWSFLLGAITTQMVA